jgi:hypothetical protein
MIATTGRLATLTAACPPAAAAARSPGRSRRPAGTSTSPAAKSSPADRTFCPAAIGWRARPVTMTLPSACGSSRSRTTTVSAPSGIGSPVSIHSQASGRTSAVSWSAVTAAARSAARTAIPSIAAHADRGDGHFAITRPVITRPSASATGTCSASGSARQPARSSLSSHSW